MSLSVGNSRDVDGNPQPNLRLDFSSLERPVPDLSLLFPFPPRPRSFESQDIEMIPDRVRPDLEASKKKVEEVEQWAPRKEEYLVMLTMAVCSLMVALDATILVTVLPVS